jgi:hypothetical protein
MVQLDQLEEEAVVVAMQLLLHLVVLVEVRLLVELEVYLAVLELQDKEIMVAQAVHTLQHILLLVVVARVQ